MVIPEPIVNVFDQLKQGQAFVTRGNEVIDDTQLIHWGYQIIKATGFFDHDCEKWRKKEQSEKDWKSFKKFSPSLTMIAKRMALLQLLSMPPTLPTKSKTFSVMNSPPYLTLLHHHLLCPMPSHHRLQPVPMQGSPLTTFAALSPKLSSSFINSQE